jgi:hypothetical protein
MGHAPLAMAAKTPAPKTDDRGLRIINTKHYELHTDLDNPLAYEMARRMDVMYEEYEKRMSEFKPAKDAPPLLAYLFTHESDYLSLTKAAGRNTGGMFVSGPHPLLAAFLEGQGRDALRRTIQHEAFHQFAYFTISKNLPAWLNEGLAQLFEEGIWTGRTFWLGQVPPRRLRQLRADAKTHALVEFNKFLAVSPEEWINNLNSNAERGAVYYNQAWAMVYFLTEGGRADYHKKFVDYLMKLHNGEDADAAFKEAFNNDPQGFQDAFSQWGGRLKASPEATMIEQEDVLGDMLTALGPKSNAARNMASFRSAVEGRELQLTYTRGNVQWKTSDRPQCYFADPNGQAYSSQNLYFQASRGAPFPDIVCRPGPSIQLRTHFYQGGKRIEHEVLIESIGR